MNEFRCSNCNKLLGMIEGKAEIKCPKCKTMNFGYDGKHFESATTVRALDKSGKQISTISYEITCKILKDEISSELIKTGKNILNMEQ